MFHQTRVNLENKADKQKLCVVCMCYAISVLICEAVVLDATFHCNELFSSTWS